MMKKILLMILAVGLLAGMGMGVCASSINEEMPEATYPVQAVYQEGGETMTVISVDIEWKGMSFTYTGPSQPQWDPVNHKYISSEGHWEPSEASITITNHSNAIILADIQYQANDTFPETKMFFTDQTPFVGSAEISETGTEDGCSVTVEAIPGGILSDKAESVTGIGTITVTVSTDLGSDSHIAAYEKLYGDYEELIRLGHDPENLERGDAYIRSEEEAAELMDALDTMLDPICDDQAEMIDRNVALNELIAIFYGALAMKH